MNARKGFDAKELRLLERDLDRDQAGRKPKPAPSITPLESAAIETAEWLRQVAEHDPACSLETSDDEDADCDCGLDDALTGLEKALGE